MVIQFIILIILSLFIGFLVYTITKISSDYIKPDNKCYVSFKESQELLGMPVLSFGCGNQRLNFILDTGSNENVVDKTAIESFTGLDIITHNRKSTSMGVDGNKIVVESCILKLCYAKKNVEVVASIRDLNQAFEIVRKEHGVIVHGLLGGKFFEENKYIIDFEHLNAYIE